MDEETESVKLKAELVSEAEKYHINIQKTVEERFKALFYIFP